MFLTLLKNIPIKFFLLVFIILCVSIFSFERGWHFCQLKNDAQYKQQYNVVIDKFNKLQNENVTLSSKYNNILSSYVNNNQKNSSEVDNEINKNATYNSCVIPIHGMFLINSAVKSANKIISAF